MTYPDITAYDILILRHLNGEEAEGLVAGAAMWTCVSYLRNRGLVAGGSELHITDAGRAYLLRIDNAERS